MTRQEPEQPRTKPLYECSGCGAQSTSPINHSHPTPLGR